LDGSSEVDVLVAGQGCGAGGCGSGGDAVADDDMEIQPEAAPVDGGETGARGTATFGDDGVESAGASPRPLMSAGHSNDCLG
jgi:hypothetical protein